MRQLSLHLDNYDEYEVAFGRFFLVNCDGVVVVVVEDGDGDGGDDVEAESYALTWFDNVHKTENSN